VEDQKRVGIRKEVAVEKENNFLILKALRII
jgi:hypothetical protein